MRKSIYLFWGNNVSTLFPFLEDILKCIIIYIEPSMMKNVNYFNIRYGGMRSRLREQIGRSRPGVRELGNKVEDARRGRRKSRWNLERGARAMVSFTLCFRGTVRLVAPCWRRDWSPRLFRGRGPCGGGGLER